MRACAHTHTHTHTLIYSLSGTLKHKLTSTSATKTST